MHRLCGTAMPCLHYRNQNKTYVLTCRLQHAIGGGQYCSAL